MAGCRDSARARRPARLARRDPRSRSRLARDVHEILERATARRCSTRTAPAVSVYDTPRNLDDDQLARSRRPGLLGLMLHPIAIGPERRTLDGVVDHLEPPLQVMGLERVCLGGTSRSVSGRRCHRRPTKDGCCRRTRAGLGIEGLTGPEHYPALVERLAARGWTRRGGRRGDERRPPALPPRLAAVTVPSRLPSDQQRIATEPQRAATQRHAATLEDVARVMDVDAAVARGRD